MGRARVAPVTRAEGREILGPAGGSGPEILVPGAARPAREGESKRQRDGDAPPDEVNAGVILRRIVRRPRPGGPYARGIREWGARSGSPARDLPPAVVRSLW